MTKAGLAAGLLLFLVPLGAAQRPVALPPILRRAIAASATLRYMGRRTVTVVKDGQTDRHEEIVTRDGARTRIEFPMGAAYAGQVVVEDGKQRRHFLPRTNEVRLLPARREEGLQRLRALARGGRIATTRGEFIAGYGTVEVSVRDEAGNTLQRLSIEPGSGLVLRRRLYDATGKEVGGFAFTKVDLDPAPFDPALFEIKRKGVTVTTPWDTLRKLAKRSGYGALGLPASSGFRLDSARLAKLPEGPVLVQNYVGPGGRLSLYQLRAAVSPERLRRQGRGALNTRSWIRKGVTFVLLGPQNEADLQRLQGLVGKAS